MKQPESENSPEKNAFDTAKALASTEEQMRNMSERTAERAKTLPPGTQEKLAAETSSATAVHNAQVLNTQREAVDQLQKRFGEEISTQQESTQGPRVKR